MIGYVTVGTRDMQRAKEFYDRLMKEMGYERLFDYKAVVGWGASNNGPRLVICRPENREPATVGNGTMVALTVSSNEEVDRLYKIALQLGASDEGAPGVRPAGLYCAYFRDLDGNKFNFHVARS